MPSEISFAVSLCHPNLIVFSSYKTFCFLSLALMWSAGCCSVMWVCWRREQPPSSKCAPASGPRPSLRLAEPGFPEFYTLVYCRGTFCTAWIHFFQLVFVYFLMSDFGRNQKVIFLNASPPHPRPLPTKKRKKMGVSHQMQTKANSFCNQSYF